MILVVTPNPSLDRTLVLPAFEEGGVLRTTQVMQTAGGKGINLAYAARSLGVEVINAGLQGGRTGDLIMRWMAEDGFAAHWTVVESFETRCTTAIVNRERGIVTIINEQGYPITTPDWERFAGDILTAAADTRIVAMCGSLPPGCPLPGYQALLRELIARGKAVWVDAAWGFLKAAIETPGVHIKVNGEEIGEILGMKVATIADATDAARRFARGRGVPCVVTLGADGAVYSDADHVWHAQPPTIEVMSAVGSGDSFLAGLLVGLDAGDAPPDALRRAVAAGAANALSIPAGRFTHEEYLLMLAGSDARLLD